LNHGSTPISRNYKAGRNQKGHKTIFISAINSHVISLQVKWAELNKDQKSVLAPLAKEWDTLRPWQRDKMLDIARDYPKMGKEKQKRVTKRLHTWSRMTPYERENARQRYQKFHNLSPEKKAELRKKWAAHQQLPEAEREKRRKDSNDLLYDPSFE